MTTENLEWVDSRAAVRELINQKLSDKGVRAVLHLQANDDGSIEGPFPLALVISETKSVGYVDRLDEVTVDITSDDMTSKSIAELIASRISGWNISTSEGYIDRIEVRNGPAELLLDSDVLDVSRVVFGFIARPK